MFIRWLQRVADLPEGETLGRRKQALGRPLAMLCQADDLVGGAPVRLRRDFQRRGLSHERVSCLQTGKLLFRFG